LDASIDFFSALSFSSSCEGGVMMRGWQVRVCESAREAERVGNGEEGARMGDAVEHA
jgi:hypothetical protein